MVPAGQAEKSVKPNGLRRATQDSASIPAYRYFVYGMTVRSEIPLALPEHGSGELGKIELRIAPASYFAKAARSLPGPSESDCFYESSLQGDGSTYVRAEGVGEFLISPDGGQITGRRYDRAHEESFQVYLLGQALSHALVKQGFEPLHATAIVVDGEAAILMGSSGFGKSSLAACFLEAGDRLLTDDLLILQPSRAGVTAYPGPARIKLFPQQAHRLLHEAAGKVAMNPETKKLILPIRQGGSASLPVPVRGIYALLPPGPAAVRKAIRITPLPPRESFMALVENTFNYQILDPLRLERQFEAASLVARLMAVKTVSYPRILARLPEVREAILADLRAPSNFSGNRQAACGD